MQIAACKRKAAACQAQLGRAPWMGSQGGVPISAGAQHYQQLSEAMKSLSVLLLFHTGQFSYLHGSSP